MFPLLIETSVLLFLEALFRMSSEYGPYFEDLNIFTNTRKDLPNISTISISKLAAKQGMIQGGNSEISDSL